MTPDKKLRVFAGTMILLSVVLTWTVSHWFAWFTVFAAVNLLQSAFTGFCPASGFLRRIGPNA
jgi:hypothetical protein